MMSLNPGEKVLLPKALTIDNVNREGVRGQGPHYLAIPVTLISDKSENCHLTLQACWDAFGQRILMDKNFQEDFKSRCESNEQALTSMGGAAFSTCK